MVPSKFPLRWDNRVSDCPALAVILSIEEPKSLYPTNEIFAEKQTMEDSSPKK
jgi:hypothetical protein